MKKPYVIAFSAAALLVLIASAIWLGADTGCGYAEVYLAGELIRTINLADFEGEFTVEDGAGGYNSVSVKNGEIGVVSANCPDKTCVRMGFISDSALPIICLPHRLEIRLVCDGADAVAY